VSDSDRPRRRSPPKLSVRRQLAKARHRAQLPAFRVSKLLQSVVCDRVASSWASDALSGSLLVRSVPAITGPLRLTTKVHPLLEPFPLSVPPRLLAVRTVRTGPASLGSCSLQRHHLGEPHTRRAVPAHLGSALRFSQPLSGFLASQSFAALFHAATVPGIPPSELSPHERRAPLSRPLAPLQLSTRVLRRSSRTLPRGFPDVHAFTQLPGSPAAWDALFTRPKTRFPVAPDPRRKTASFRQLHLLRSLLFLPRVRSRLPRVAP
jgi:hypothetical protein